MTDCSIWLTCSSRRTLSTVRPIESLHPRSRRLCVSLISSSKPRTHVWTLQALLRLLSVSLTALMLAFALVTASCFGSTFLYASSHLHKIVAYVQKLFAARETWPTLSGCKCFLHFICLCLILFDFKKHFFNWIGFISKNILEFAESFLHFLRTCSLQ